MAQKSPDLSDGAKLDRLTRLNKKLHHPLSEKSFLFSENNQDGIKLSFLAHLHY